MKKILACILVCALLGGICTATKTVAHEYYVSHCDLRYHTTDLKMHALLKLDAEDFESVLQKISHQKLFLNEPKHQKSIDSLSAWYFSEHIKIEVDHGQKLTMLFMHKELKGDLVYVRLSTKAFEPSKEFSIQNQVFFSQFPKQENLVHFYSDRGVETKRCNASQQVVSFKF